MQFSLRQILTQIKNKKDMAVKKIKRPLKCVTCLLLSFKIFGRTANQEDEAAQLNLSQLYDSSSQQN